MAALRDLRLSLLIATLVAGGAAGAIALSGRAPHIKPDALKSAVQARLGMPIVALSLAPGGDAPWGPGDPVQLWFTAGDPPDLFRFSARQVGRSTSLHGAPRRLRETPFSAEEIVLTRADQALVGLRDGDAVQVIALHAAAPMALYLNAPTRSLRGEWTPTGFAVTTDAGAVTVDTAQGTVTPASAGRWLADEPATALRIDGIDEAPQPIEHRWTSGETITRDGIKLTAYDSRAVALRYMPGVVQPGGVHGRPRAGIGSADALAWLSVSASGGAAVNGTLLAPMARDGMAIALNSTGKAQIGLFAGEPIAPRDGALRQAGVALVLDGRPVRVKSAPRIQRGFGITKDGWIILAEAPPTPRFEVAQALARAGVVQAVALSPQTDTRPAAESEAFAVVKRRGFAAPRWMADQWTPRSGALATRRSGAVELALIATDANRLQVVPGALEIGGRGPAATGDWCLTGGVRSDRAPYGLSIGADTRRTPREGVLSLLVDKNGRARMGLTSAKTDDALSVLQGPQLIRDGRAAIEDRRVEPGVLTAIGARADGRLVYAQTSAAVGTLVDALLAVQVIDAIRIGDVSASDAGRILPARDLVDGEGTALCLTTTLPPPSVLPAKTIRAW